MRNFFSSVYIILCVVATILFFPKYYLLGLFKDPRVQVRYASKIARRWGKWTINGLGIKVNIKGLENIPKDKTLVIISNHQSNFDIPVLAGCLPIDFGFLAKQELSRIPIFNLWMKYFKCVFIERNNPKKSITAINNAIENVNNGYSQLVFPEGTRSRSSQMNHFKAGSLRIALKTNAVILPVTINGTYKLYEENHSIKSGDISLTIHKYINLSELSKEQKEDLPERLFELIESTIEK